MLLQFRIQNLYRMITNSLDN